jgi:hypothetical protein
VTASPRALVWLPLLAVVLGLVVLASTTVVVGLWVLSGLALAGAIARALGWEGTVLRVRRRFVDTAILASLSALLMFLATSGVLG